MISKKDERVVWTDKPHNFLGLAINFTRYFLTAEKLIIRKGFLNIKEDEILLYRIMDKKIYRPLSQRIFKCGSVTVSAKDVYNAETTLKAVKRVDGLIETLDRLINDARKANNISTREFYGMDGGGGDMF